MTINANLTQFRCIFLLTCMIIIALTLVNCLFKTMSVNKSNIFQKHKHDDIPPYISGKRSHLHWFVQVTDIHISLFYDKKRAPDLKYFINSHINEIIKPKVVLVTGDITDAKFANRQGSTQFLEEWQAYNDILIETNVLNKTVWLDIRGNHDAFNVPALDARENMFRKHSSQGKKHERSYKYDYKGSDGDVVSFIGVDACPDPGPKRPFNFFGVLKEEDLTFLKTLKEDSLQSNMTLWFGHYPTSVIWSPKPGIRSIMSDSVYMSGHLHNLLGYAPTMYAVQDEGLLEIELADWKDNRAYRVFAVDHGLLSFTDVRYDHWPVILITNPKHGKFNLPKFEPTGRMKHSTHIRILVFSKWDITTVQVKINNKEKGEAVHVEGALYVLPWQPDLFLTGVHKIQVFVQDTGGNKQTITQPFSLDNSEALQFGVFQRYILMINHIFVLQSVFWVSLCWAVIPLLISRVCSIHIEANMNGNSCRGGFARYIQVWIRRLYMIANTDKLFYLILGFNLYIAIGPWFIGELVSGEIGAAFVYGLYIKGKFIPGTLTYLYGSFQIVTFNIPMTLYLARARDSFFSEHKQKDHSAKQKGSSANKAMSSSTTVLEWIYNNGVFIVLLLFQFYLSVTGFYLAYGGVVYLLCPIRTWSIPFAIYLRYLAVNHKRSPESNSVIKKDMLKNAAR